MKYQFPRPLYWMICVLGLLLAAPVSSAANVTTTSVENVSTSASTAALSKKELRKMKKAQRKEARKARRAALKALLKSADIGLAGLIIITILIPPLGMYLHEGDITNRFWISLLLTLLFYLPGLIYTLVVILGEN